MAERVAFGLGTSTATRLQVHWPGGVVQVVTALPPHGAVLVEEEEPSDRTCLRRCDVPVTVVDH